MNFYAKQPQQSSPQSIFSSCKISITWLNGSCLKWKGAFSCKFLHEKTFLRFFVSTASGRKMKSEYMLLVLACSIATYSARACTHNSSPKKNFAQRRRNLLSRWGSPKQWWQQKLYYSKLHLTFMEKKNWRKNRNLKLDSRLEYLFHGLLIMKIATGLSLSFCAPLLYCFFSLLSSEIKNSGGKELHIKMASSWNRIRSKNENKKSAMGFCGRRKAMTWGWML